VRKRLPHLSYVVAPLTVLLALLAVAAFTGEWPTATHGYNSYVLQAQAWLDGRLDLGLDYPWLELAIYEGKYFVSFPPFPSYVMLPFVALNGIFISDGFIAWAVTLLGAVYATALYRHYRRDDKGVFWVTFLYLGTVAIGISLNAWVWFIAQSMCFTLSLMAITHAAKGHGGMALTCWACAVGCRPMAAVYLPVLVMLLYQAHRPTSVLKWVKRRWYWAIGPCLLAASYMWLNWARFGNVLEFGHNYLPEFVQAENGQFSLAYLTKNLNLLLRMPVFTNGESPLIFEKFDTMAFWLINPMFISIFIAWVMALTKKGKRGEAILLMALALCHVFIICCHKTLGAWQFGNRYLVDLMPWLFLGLMKWMPEKSRLTLISQPLMIWGVLINLMGTVAVYNRWI